jgi:hypothetical protein
LASSLFADLEEPESMLSFDVHTKIACQALTGRLSLVGRLFLEPIPTALDRPKGDYAVMD